MSDILVAKQSFACVVDGQPVTVQAGQTVRAGHPVTAGREALFEPLKVAFDHQPDSGERKRGPGRPKPPRDAKGNTIRVGGE